MARPHREQSDPRVIRDWIKEGRGQNRNGLYKPWLNIQDVPSDGIRTQLTSPITGDRALQLMSGLETFWLFILEFLFHATDVREQLPLLEFDSITPDMPVDQILKSTMDIANELGVEHHMNRQLQMSIVPSTDFVATIPIDGGTYEHAFEIKHWSKLSSLRTQQKLEMSRLWHLRHGHKWSLVTDRDIPKHLASNLGFLRGRSDLSRFGGVADSDLERIERAMLPAIWGGQDSLSKVAADSDAKLGLDDGTSLTVAYNFIYTRRWKLNSDYLLARLQPGCPLPLVSPSQKDSNGHPNI
jgi:hypothetical protein